MSETELVHFGEKNQTEILTQDALDAYKNLVSSPKSMFESIADNFVKLQIMVDKDPNARDMLSLINTQIMLFKMRFGEQNIEGDNNNKNFTQEILELIREDNKGNKVTQRIINPTKEQAILIEENTHGN